MFGKIIAGGQKSSKLIRRQRGIFQPGKCALYEIAPAMRRV